MFMLKQATIRVTLCLLAAVVTGVALQAQVNIPLDRQAGEVFVGIGSGNYQVWHPTPPTANLVETISQNFNNASFRGATAGCNFDPTYHPFTTNLANNDIFRHAIEDPQNGIAQISVSGAGGANPTSIAFDAVGNSYVGMGGGNGLIQEYDPSGAFVRTLPIKTTSLKGGSPWIDLSANSNTIYFTNGTNSISQFAVSSDKTSKFASVSGATLYALRVLTSAGQAATANVPKGPGLLLVAAVFSGSSNIQLFNASGVSIKTYSVSGENNFQALTLDANGTSFWVANPTTKNFYRINLATGNIEVSANTLSGSPTGLCSYGGFGAALYQPITVQTTFSSSSSPGCTLNSQNSSLADCTFSTPIPDLTNGPNSFAITVNGINFLNAPSGVQITYNYSQIAQAAGTSDTGLPCELLSPDGTKCEVHSVDVYPNNGSSDTLIYQGFDLDMFSTQSALNPKTFKNEVHDLTDFVIHGSTRTGGSDTTKSTFTVHEQPIQVTGAHSCGYITPLLNSQFNQGRVIPFKFLAVSPPNTCPTGPNFLTQLTARLVLVQLNNLSPTAAPHRVDFMLSNGTSCTESSPCFYRLDPSSGTWILNVDTSSLQGSVNGVPTQYLGTTFEDSNQIPSFSVTQFGQVDIFDVD